MPMQQKAHFRVPPLDTAVLNAFDCVLQASQELQDNAIGLYDVKLTKYQLSSLQVGRGACGFAAEQFGGGIDGLQCIGGREAVI